MLWRWPSAASSPSGSVIHRGISSCCQPSRVGAAAQHARWRRVGAPGSGPTTERRSTSSAIVDSSSRSKSAIAKSVAPAVEHLGRRAPVEAAVDLGAAAGAAPLGVGDRRQPEGDGDAAGAVLAVHLLERERHDRCPARPTRPPRPRARRSRPRRAAPRWSRRRRRSRSTSTSAPSAARGAAAVTRDAPRRRGVRPVLPDVRVAERAHEPGVLAEDRQRPVDEAAGDRQPPGNDEQRAVHGRRSP